jgi:hypothetical protein
MGGKPPPVKQIWLLTLTWLWESLQAAVTRLWVWR